MTRVEGELKEARKSLKSKVQAEAAAKKEAEQPMKRQRAEPKGEDVTCEEMAERSVLSARENQRERRTHTVTRNEREITRLEGTLRKRN